MQRQASGALRWSSMCSEACAGCTAGADRILYLCSAKDAVKRKRGPSAFNIFMQRTMQDMKSKGYKPADDAPRNGELIYDLAVQAVHIFKHLSGWHPLHSPVLADPYSRNKLPWPELCNGAELFTLAVGEWNKLTAAQKAKFNDEFKAEGAAGDEPHELAQLPASSHPIAVDASGDEKVRDFQLVQLCCTVDQSVSSARLARQMWPMLCRGS